jgi:predicted RNase H-like HicB family nuclease
MTEVFFLVEEALEGGYTAKALGESIFTEGETLEELKVNVKEAVHCHFEEDDLPKIIRLHLVKEELLTV